MFKERSASYLTYKVAFRLDQDSEKKFENSKYAHRRDDEREMKLFPHAG